MDPYIVSLEQTLFQSTHPVRGATNLSCKSE